MISALNVAEYLLTLVNENEGDLMSNLKLQKLLYYVQGFYLAQYGDPLFHEEIVHWTYGPVVPEVYHAYKEHGRRGIPAPDNPDFSELTPAACQVIEDVYKEYGQYEASVLMHFTHEEPPWQSTSHNEVISCQKLKTYFKTQLVA